MSTKDDVNEVKELLEEGSGTRSSDSSGVSDLLYEWKSDRGSALNTETLQMMLEQVVPTYCSIKVTEDEALGNTRGFRVELRRPNRSKIESLVFYLDPGELSRRWEPGEDLEEFKSYMTEVLDRQGWIDPYTKRMNNITRAIWEMEVKYRQDILQGTYPVGVVASDITNHIKKQTK